MMSVYPFEYERRAYVSPMERMLVRLIDDYDRSASSVAPYWRDVPLAQQCNIGNAVGKVVNDKDKFAVELDVSQFHPEELTVNVKGHELVVEGHHEERNDENGTIERHFVRKYALPEDAHLDSVESHLSDHGVLCVSAKKLAVNGPAGRTIPIKAARHKKEDTKKTAENAAGKK